ncbi:MAG: hypothetical protein WCZ02_08115, partial [Lysobacterales bacterium]
WAFWLQVSGMFGMTLAFGTAGIGQVYLERIMGMGYLDAQMKIQVHFLMLILAATVFASGVAIFIYEFFRHRPRFDVVDDEVLAAPVVDPVTGQVTGSPTGPVAAHPVAEPAPDPVVRREH